MLFLAVGTKLVQFIICFRFHRLAIVHTVAIQFYIAQENKKEQIEKIIFEAHDGSFWGARKYMVHDVRLRRC